MKSFFTITFSLFFCVALTSCGGSATSSDASSESTCGCSVPNPYIPSYSNSWDDKAENWQYKECTIADYGTEFAEKIHIYLFYNSKMNKYRCEVRYSYPGDDCRMSAKVNGSSAPSTADITNEDYSSGAWKSTYYWKSRGGY